MGNGLAYRFLGLTAGGVTLRDGLLPGFRPWPGVDEVAAPLAWYDSAAVAVGEGAGWRGFGASAVELRALASVPHQRRPRAAFTFVNGSSAIERVGLMLQRGDSASWLRSGALAEKRAGTGLLGQRAQHVWFVDLGQQRGEHTFAAAFSQRGAANATQSDRRFRLSNFVPPFAGLEEAARGEAGSLEWRWEHGKRQLNARFERSHDRRESFESEFFDIFSEREAQENGVVIELAGGGPGRSHGLRLDLRQGQVRRSADFLGDITAVRPPRVADQHSAWLAGRGQRSLLGGQLEAQWGVGYTSAPALRAERLQSSPSLSWAATNGPRRLRIYAERMVTPVWSDLAVNVKPFIQDTWLAGFSAGIGERSQRWLELDALAASIANRAQLQSWPVRDVALRYGWTRDEVRVNDAQVTLSGGLRQGDYAVDVAGFARVRPLGQQQAQLDPAIGARLGTQGGFRVFAGDLGVLLRLEGAWVGSRENVSLPEYFAFPRQLAGYATFGGSLALTVGDARIVIRGMNLEDQLHPQIWTDPTSPFPGTVAVGSGRQFRVELAWPLFN
jgi:hypothetical protein